MSSSLSTPSTSEYTSAPSYESHDGFANSTAHDVLISQLINYVLESFSSLDDSENEMSNDTQSSNECGTDALVPDSSYQSDGSFLDSDDEDLQKGPNKRSESEDNIPIGLSLNQSRSHLPQIEDSKFFLARKHLQILGAGIGRRQINLITFQRGSNGQNLPVPLSTITQSNSTRLAQSPTGSSIPQDFLLDQLKYVCNVIWRSVFGRPIDNLKTNNRGTFVLVDLVGKWVSGTSNLESYGLPPVIAAEKMAVLSNVMAQSKRSRSQNAPQNTGNLICNPRIYQDLVINFQCGLLQGWLEELGWRAGISGEIIKTEDTSVWNGIQFRIEYLGDITASNTPSLALR